MFDGKKMYQCPALFIHPAVKEYINMYSDYKRGFLPFPGTVQQQPVKIMEIFGILESAEIDNEKRRRKDVSKIMEQ